MATSVKDVLAPYSKSAPFRSGVSCARSQTLQGKRLMRPPVVRVPLQQSLKSGRAANPSHARCIIEPRLRTVC